MDLTRKRRNGTTLMALALSRGVFVRKNSVGGKIVAPFSAAFPPKNKR